MKFVKHIFLLGLGIAGIMPAFSQHAYTLDACIHEALVNNTRIKNADNDLAAARHVQQEAFTKFFPSFNAFGTGFTADKGLVEMEMIPGEKLSMMKNGVIGGITAAVPLFTGGQIVNGNKLSAVNVEVNRLQRRQSEKEVRLTVEQYFWQIVMLKEKLRTLSIVGEQLSSIHKDVDAAVQAGVSNRNDLLQVQLKENETRSTRIQVENALAVSTSLLAQYMGHPSDSVDVDMVLTDSLPDHPGELYVLPESSLPATDEYNLLQQNVKAARLEHKISIGENLPLLSVGGGYVYDNLMDKDHSFWVGFATVSVPLSGWWGGFHDIKRQQLKVRNAENQLTDQSQLLVIRMNNTWNSLTDAYKQVEIAIESIGQASENLRLQTDYYRAGTCTMSDLLEAQTLFQQSRDRYVESYAQYEVKKREYLQATGR